MTKYVAKIVRYEKTFGEIEIDADSQEAAEAKASHLVFQCRYPGEAIQWKHHVVQSVHVDTVHEVKST